jgi:DNA-binding CsgD family transcriptional regulator
MTEKSIMHYWEKLKPEQNVHARIQENWKRKAGIIDTIYTESNMVTFLWNVYTHRYIYVSDKLRQASGLDPALYLDDNGFEFSLSRIHPQHLDAIGAFSRLCTKYLASNNGLDPKIARVCLNFLYKNGRGEYVQLIQRMSVLETDKNLKPLLIACYVLHIGHIKKADSVGCVISVPGQVNIFEYNQHDKCVELPITFSDKEKNLLHLLSLGLSTKKIAQQLHISPLTVNTHRRNLIKKTACRDTTAAVTFARMINLI